MKEDRDDFDNWLVENEDKPEVDAVLRRMYSSSADGSAQEADRAFTVFSGKVGMKKKPVPVRQIVFRIAAVLAVPMCLFGAWSLNRALTAEPEWVQVATSYSESGKIDLPDGTNVMLSPCSQLFYPSAFRGRQRKVILVGEAFLDVAKDSRRQFVVSTGRMNVVVHGTRFNVNAFPDNVEDEVALLEGSVEMRFPGKESSVFLSPGDLVKYERSTGSVIRRSFAANYFEEVLASGGLQFRNAQLSDIVAALDRQFNVKIVIQDADLASERYYASFINGEDADEILAALNTGGHFHINKKDDIIYISK
ncbi:MAG: FecR domain-containing protein [Bacteroidales bacterium]|nr:FecR domain-containing protein [Bacteroidales bacterium]